MYSQPDSDVEYVGEIYGADDMSVLHRRAASAAIRNSAISSKRKEKMVDAKKFQYLEDMEGVSYPSYMSHSPSYGCLGSCSCAFAVQYITPEFRTDNEMKALPRLKDKLAARITLYREELYDASIMDNLHKVNMLVLVVTEKCREFEFAGLCIEKICAFYKSKGRKYVPVPPRYYTTIGYFWLTIKIFKKLCRRYPTQMDPITTELCNKFGNFSLISSNPIYRQAKHLIEKHFEKFSGIKRQVKEIETFFKGHMKHEILESAYTEHHWYFGVLVKKLNNIKCDMRLLGLSKCHLEYFAEDFRLGKKRLYGIIAKLDADMKRSADRTHAQRIASVEHYVELVIEKATVLSESESEEQRDAERYETNYDSDDVTISDIW